MEKKMENKNLEVFRNAPVPQAVLKNVLPAMAAMIMVLIYNLADTFFIGQTRNAILIAAVSLAMPVLFLVFMDQILMLVGASPDTMGPAKHRLEIQTLQHQARVAQGRFDSGQERGNVVNCFLQFTASFILQNIETP